jgi:hypothetical protein
MKTCGKVLKHPREAPIAGPTGKSRWRTLDEVEPGVQWRSVERYPYPPLKMPLRGEGDESVEGAGYWLLDGDLWDMPVASTLH